ncbi:MAG: FkbM family methyltransferase [Planctomycetota bacterium]
MGIVRSLVDRTVGWISKPPVPFSESTLIRRFLQRLGVRHGVMIDVGAHFGESLLPYAEMGWAVYAFEPDPCPKKAEALKRLESDRVKIFPLAVSDRSGEQVDFYASSVSTGIASMSAFHESHHKIATVRTETLANVMADQSIDRVDFLKIDAEAHDLFVLRGFNWERRPRVVIAEFEDGKTEPLGYLHTDLCEFLREKDYAVYLSEWHPIKQYGITHQWRSIQSWPCDLHDSRAWGNVIGIEKASVKTFERLLPKP